MSRITSAEYQAGYAAGFRDGKKEGLENASDLLAALEKAAVWLQDELRFDLTDIHAAIAKAKGEA